MNTEQAKQLRLAATILETGHPWEYNHDKDFWQKSSGNSVLFAVSEGRPIRLTLATPPDGRALHNPDYLTAEQVGAGYRLTLPGEKLNANYDYWPFEGGWEKGHGTGIASKLHFGASMRLPLSVPWPEAEKPGYADEKKTVPLGPEDVRPFTVIRRKGEAQTWHWRTVSYVDAVKVTCGNRGYEWNELASSYERNESLPLTGKWDANAWEPCSKEVAA